MGFLQSVIADARPRRGRPITTGEPSPVAAWAGSVLDNPGGNNRLAGADRASEPVRGVIDHGLRKSAAPGEGIVVLKAANDLGHFESTVKRVEGNTFVGGPVSVGDGREQEIGSSAELGIPQASPVPLSTSLSDSKNVTPGSVERELPLWVSALGGARPFGENQLEEEAGREIEQNATLSAPLGGNEVDSKSPVSSEVSQLLKDPPAPEERNVPYESPQVGLPTITGGVVQDQSEGGVEERPTPAREEILRGTPGRSAAEDAFAVSENSISTSPGSDEKKSMISRFHQSEEAPRLKKNYGVKEGFRSDQRSFSAAMAMDTYKSADTKIVLVPKSGEKKIVTSETSSDTEFSRAVEPLVTYRSDPARPLEADLSEKAIDALYSAASIRPPEKINETPRVEIGQIDVIIEATQRPSVTAAAVTPPADLASRHYLRRL